MDLSEFCEVTGKGQKEVYALLRCQYYPDELIIGGYEGRKRKKKLLFDTQKVLEWMRR
jgi:predicted DNA-binding transcriptional regulator AlpA